MKITKIKKFLKENRGSIDLEESYHIMGTVKNKRFSISAYTGNRGNTIKGFIVKCAGETNDYCITQIDVINFIGGKINEI